MGQVAKMRLALDGVTGPEDFPSLVKALRGRGYDGQRLEAIMSGNWLRILREALPP
jgi:microsomal dipeptidase-like Zn-dependent dipeptidase